MTTSWSAKRTDWHHDRGAGCFDKDQFSYKLLANSEITAQLVKRIRCNILLVAVLCKREKGRDAD